MCYIFNSRISWTDHVTWRICICICVLKESEVKVTMCNCFVPYFVVRGTMMMKGREKVIPGAGTQATPVDKHQGDRQASHPHPTDKTLSTV